MKSKEQDCQDYIRRFQQLLLGITLLSLLVSGGFMVCGRPVIFILYGKSYMEAAAPLSILIWSTGAAMIGTARSVWIVAEGYYKYSKYFTLMGALVNFLLNYFAIRAWGITGAAITTLISQIFVAFIAPLLFARTRAFAKIYLASFKQLPDLIAFIHRCL